MKKEPKRTKKEPKRTKKEPKKNHFWENRFKKKY